jgi:hypothetical protein
MSEATERLSRDAAAALGRSLADPFGRFFDDPEISEACVKAQNCARRAHDVFGYLRYALIPPPETGFVPVTPEQLETIEALLPKSGLTLKEVLAGYKSTTGGAPLVPRQDLGPFVARRVRALFAAIQEFQILLEGECGSDPHRDFILFGSPYSVATVHARCAHEAALKLGKWVLDEIWNAAFDYNYCLPDRPWRSMKYLPPDELQLKPVEERFSFIVQHFQTLDVWNVDELLVKLEKEAIMTGTARAKERRTPPSAMPSTEPSGPQSAAFNKLDEIKRALSCLRGIFSRWHVFYSQFAKPIKALDDYGMATPPIVIGANGEGACLAQDTRLALTALDGHRVFPPALRGLKLEDAIAKFPAWPTGPISAARNKAFLENLPVELDQLTQIYVELGDLETQLEFALLSVLERADVTVGGAPAVGQAGLQTLVAADDAVAQPGSAAEPTLAEDDSAYRPAIEFIDSQRFPTLKAIRQALTANPTIRTRRPTGKNGKAIPNRLNIHAGDWHAFIRKQTADPLDLPATVVDAVMETEQRKVEIRKQKDAEK